MGLLLVQIVKIGLAAIAIIAAICWPSMGDRRWRAVERQLGKLAGKRGLSIVLVSLSPVLLRLAFLPWIPIPQPSVHDEFSYLLAADTFASGRITNPTHPMWMHFESFHINMKPTYMSMYFPAQGLFLALGKVLLGHPWFGVLFSTALMCGAICWMLQGWLPPGWALFGAALAVLRLFILWGNSYYGGAVAALGGALVLGALPRLLRAPRTRDGLWMATGILVLANSRPYEGFLICAPAVLVLAWRCLRNPGAGLLARRLLTPAVLAPVALLSAGFFLMGYYNFRVFGNPFTLAYLTNRATYAVAPVFVWMHPYPEPLYRHKVMHDFYTGWELTTFQNARNIVGFAYSTMGKIGAFTMFFFGTVLLPALLLSHRVARDRRARLLLIFAGIFALRVAVSAFFLPHYAAPFAGAFYVLTIQGYRHLRASGLRFGRSLVRLTLPLCVVLVVLQPLAVIWLGTEPVGLRRASVLAKLESFPGRQLAIVRYASNHSPHDEWVYNAADIDRSKVVWAREMDPVHDKELIRYYPDRSVWLVEPDAGPARISPLKH